MIGKYNTLGKICLACAFANLVLAFIMAHDGHPIAMLNVLSAFMCHLGSFSKKCRN